MVHAARRCSPVPGRNLMVVAAMMVGAGCAQDEPLRPSLKPAPQTAVPNVTEDPTNDFAPHLTRWGTLNDDSLWIRIRDAGGTADVGLRPPGKAKGMERGRVLLNRSQRAAQAAVVRAMPGVELLTADTLLPIVKVRLAGRDALAALRRLPQVEYVEPGAFSDANVPRGLRWNGIEFGCSVSGYGGPANTYISPGDLLPWNYRVMQIDSAWNYSSGAGATISIVDTGVDEQVPELNALFASGMSSGRIFTKTATKPHFGSLYPWHDTCGHGTRMASVIGAPRNGLGILGVAWRSNLHMVRVDNDVILTEVEATRLGIRNAATVSRIVAMAFGTYAYYSSIAQELEYWYFYSNRSIFVAAGTTSCWDPAHWVTFPGTLETVTTVTAFDQTGSIACNSSRGWQVDFAAVTNQPAQGHHNLGSTLAGLHGSSGATAVIAGLAGLYLSRNPTADRGSLMSALIVAASPAGGRSPLWGFGVPNAMCLMKEMCYSWIDGPNLIQQTGTYTWKAQQRASPGPIAYQWSTGQTSQTISRNIVVYPGMPEYAFTVNVTIRDTRNGKTRNVSKLVVVRDPYQCPTCF